jgi:hypothetical protein
VTAARRDERPLRRRRPRWFFVPFAVVSGLLAIAGFTRSFVLPVARGGFSAPAFVHVHGALFVAWVVLLITQSVLVARRHVGLHRSLGWVAAALVPAMLVSGVVVAIWATRREVRAGVGDAPLAFFLGNLTDLATFGLLAGWALLGRRPPETHRRLIAMATIVLLGAPAIRLVSPVTVHVVAGLTAVTLAFIGAVVGYDLRSSGRVHPVTLWGGVAVLANLLAQGPLGATAAWLTVARRIISD